MTKPITKADPPLKTNQQLLDLINERISLPSVETGVNDFDIVEGAIGAVFVGQYYGMRVLRIIHAASTLRKYEKFFGVPFDELVPQHGPMIDRSLAWRIVTTTRQYWDLVSRRFRMEEREKRTIVDVST